MPLRKAFYKIFLYQSLIIMPAQAVGIYFYTLLLVRFHLFLLSCKFKLHNGNGQSFQVHESFFSMYLFTLPYREPVLGTGTEIFPCLGNGFNASAIRHYLYFLGKVPFIDEIDEQVIRLRIIARPAPYES